MIRRRGEGRGRENQEKEVERRRAFEGIGSGPDVVTVSCLFAGGGRNGPSSEIGRVWEGEGIDRFIYR